MFGKLLCGVAVVLSQPQRVEPIAALSVPHQRVVPECSENQTRRVAFI